MAEALRTDRLVVRGWSESDDVAALAVFGQPEVTRWLSPALMEVHDLEAMRSLLHRWITESRESEAGLGHWAITLAGSGALVGGVSLHPLPVDEQDVEVGWQVAPEHWNLGYGTEAGRAVIRRAFALDIDEVFALVRPANRRGEAAARRIGMTWVGETDKYYDLRLNVFRLRSSDLLDRSGVNFSTGEFEARDFSPVDPSAPQT